MFYIDMNRKKLKKDNNSEFIKTSPECLLSQCIQYVAEHLCCVDSFFGLPDLIGEQIFKRANSLDKFNLDDKSSLHALAIFTNPYEELVASSLNLSYQHLGINFCQDHINLFTALREIDLTGCKLGDNHDLMSHLGQLECLENVCLRDNSLSDTGIQRFTSPYRVCNKGPAGLARLDISDNWEITGKCYKFFNPFSKLKQVDITSTQVKGNPELLKTWKFKPMKDDGAKINNTGWAGDIVQKWMKSAVDKAYSVRVKKKLTQAQQFYKAKRKIQTSGNSKEQEIQHNVIGYRLLLVRIVKNCEKNEQKDKYLSDNASIQSAKQHLSVSRNMCTNDLEKSDMELLNCYTSCTQSTRQEQKLTLKSGVW